MLCSRRWCSSRDGHRFVYMSFHRGRSAHRLKASATVGDDERDDIPSLWKKPQVLSPMWVRFR